MEIIPSLTDQQKKLAQGSTLPTSNLELGKQEHSYIAYIIRACAGRISESDEAQLGVPEEEPRSNGHEYKVKGLSATQIKKAGHARSRKFRELSKVSQSNFFGHSKEIKEMMNLLVQTYLMFDTAGRGFISKVSILTCL
jgi:hypothetical protein